MGGLGCVGIPIRGWFPTGCELIKKFGLDEELDALLERVVEEGVRPVRISTTGWAAPFLVEGGASDSNDIRLEPVVLEADGVGFTGWGQCSY